MFSEHLFQQPPRRRGSDRRERVEAERPVSRRREAGTGAGEPELVLGFSSMFNNEDVDFQQQIRNFSIF